jgi:hypothetical protein
MLNKAKSYGKVAGSKSRPNTNSVNTRADEVTTQMTRANLLSPCGLGEISEGPKNGYISLSKQWLNRSNV